MKSSNTKPLLNAKYPATREGVAAALSDLDRLPIPSGWPDALPNTLRLAIEELSINAVDYGGQSPVEGWFAVRISEAPNIIELMVDDAGRPFDTSQSGEPDLGAPIDERAIGGLGLHLVRSLAKHFSYQRIHNLNRTIVIFNSVPS
jgi:serine/threonine-protein kinase RsbW